LIWEINPNEKAMAGSVNGMKSTRTMIEKPTPPRTNLAAFSSLDAFIR
jgi:hypothetical protein